jgi:tripeptidyl-peptidase-1
MRTFLFSLLAGAAFARPSVPYSEFSRLQAIPAQWQADDQDKPSGNAQVRLSIHLKQKDAAKFEKHVVDLSTPGHPLYGKHMSQDEINEMIKPAAETTRAVVEWLGHCGMSNRHTVQNDWIHVNASLAEVEDMLQTKYEVFKSGDNRRIRTRGYSLPTHLHEHVNMITPTTMLGQPKQMKWHHLADDSTYLQDVQTADASADEAGVCTSTVSPTCLRSLYNMGNYQAPKSDNVLGIAGYLEQYVQNKDLTSFVSHFAPWAAGASYKFVAVNGGLNTQGGSNGFEEANLDIQYGFALGPPNLIYYQTAGRPPIVEEADNKGKNDNEPYLDFLNYILAQPNPPATISTSYGEDEQSVPQDYANSVCNKLAQLGARGVSVIFSSGDGGPGTSCQDFAANKPQLEATFPASCPYVTGVGATSGFNPEGAVSFSGGGFSKYWPAQQYQESAIASYKKLAGSLNAGLYSTTGRGVPDVSAQGLNFRVVNGGENATISGTSAAAPAFAAMISQLNGALIAAGKKPLGFLNPFLYSNGRAGLTDITSGSSVGCQSEEYNNLPSVKWYVLNYLVRRNLMRMIC